MCDGVGEALVNGGAFGVFTVPWSAAPGAARSAPVVGVEGVESCPWATADAHVMSHTADSTGKRQKRRGNANEASARIGVNSFITLPGSSFL